MDRLTAFVAASHLKLRLDYFLYLLERQKMPTPNLQGLTKAMEMLEHELEHDASGLMTKIQSVGGRGKAAIAKGHTRIDGVATRIGQVEKFVTAIEGSNGGDPLDDSSNSSGKPSPKEESRAPDGEEMAAGAAEPAASWGGQK